MYQHRTAAIEVQDCKKRIGPMKNSKMIPVELNGLINGWTKKSNGRGATSSVATKNVTTPL